MWEYEHGFKADASAEEIWALWADVDGWALAQTTTKERPR
jgi:hypothetical protein